MHLKTGCNRTESMRHKVQECSYSEMLETSLNIFHPLSFINNWSFSGKVFEAQIHMLKTNLSNMNNNMVHETKNAYTSAFWGFYQDSIHTSNINTYYNVALSPSSSISNEKNNPLSHRISNFVSRHEVIWSTYTLCCRRKRVKKHMWGMRYLHHM